MDDFELSSICSESSKNSECLYSDVSTLSGVGEYESEFLDLKQLVNSDQEITTSKKYNVEKNDAIDLYQKQITTLSNSLKSTLKQNEEYKKTVNYLKNESDIICHERTEKLLQQNKQLRANLEIANNQIQRLFNIYATDDHHKNSDGQKLTVWNLEKRNYELSKQNHLLTEKINQSSSHSKEIETEYKILKGEVNYVKLELGASENCVEELKKKISEQHVKLQRLSENNAQLTHSLDLMSSELQYKNKTEEWYKQQLTEQQKQKNVLQQNNLQNEKSLAIKEKKIEYLTLEVNNWKHNYNDLQLTVSRQKERLLKQTSNIDKQVNKTEHTHDDANNDIEMVTSYYKTIIDDLNEDIKRIKLELDSQRDYLNMVLEEKSNLLINYLSLQNCVKEKENNVEHLQSTITELTQKIDILSKDNLKQKFKLLDTSKTCTKLKAEVDAKNREKEIVEKSIGMIKKQFKTFKTKHARLSDELSLKNREYSLLSDENYKIQTDNNRKICSLEQNIEEYLNEIENLKKEISVLEHNKNSNKSCGHLKEIEALNEEILKLQRSLKQVQTDFLNLLSSGQQFTSIFEKGDNLLNTTNIPHQENSTENNTLLDLLRHIGKFCFVDEDFLTSIQQCDFNVTDKQKNYFKIILNGILMRLQLSEIETVFKDNQVLELRKKINDLKLSCKSRIERLENRCENLFEKTENNARITDLLNCSNLSKSNDEINNLRTSLEVKVQEAKENRKRYERNYRTLLKKVKEHMKGRSVAEKHNAQLQQLNSILSEESNALRLQLDSKNAIRNLQFGTEKNKRYSEEKVNVEKQDCSKCDILKKDIKRLNGENQELLSELYSSKILIETNDSKIMSYTSTNEALRTQVKELDIILEKERLQNEHLEAQVTTMKQQICDLCNGNSQMSKKLESVEEREFYLREQNKNLNQCISEKANEIIDLNNKKYYSEKKLLEKEKNMVMLIKSLKREINEFKDDIDRMKTEKFFLQRLCNDLKVALTVHVTHNKALKEYLNNASKHIDSSMLSKFPSPTKSNDALIQKLLQQSTEQDKPPRDIYEGMDSLKNQITFLQKIICVKSFDNM